MVPLRSQRCGLGSGEPASGCSDLGSTHFDSAASSLAEALNDTDDWVVNCIIQCIHSVAKPIGDVKTKVQTEVHMHLGSDF